MKRLAWILAVVAGISVGGVQAEAKDQAQKDVVAEVPASAVESSRHCLRSTGTRIKREGCLPVAGRVYSREELERTGEVNLNEALRRVSPSLR